MDHQHAERVACSSHDLVRAVARKLKFYTELKRREDGFDLTPSALPQMLFPRLLPRPMLQSALQDISIKHHFTHAQVRCALARIQSSKFPPSNMMSPQREKQIWKLFRRIYNASSFDHPMTAANDEYNALINERTNLENRKTVKTLQDGVKTVRRAPPPGINNSEQKRLVEASWKIILNVESCTKTSPRKPMELGNTKLQSLHRASSMQRSFMAPVHKPFVPEPPISKISPLLIQPKYIYDLDGRRHRVTVVET